MKNEHDIIDALMKLIRGELDSQKAAALEEAIKTDPETADLYALVKNLQKARMERSVPGEISSAKKLSAQLFRDFLKSKTHPEAHLAVNVFDSGVLPLPEGVRPAAVDTRRLKYRMDDWEVDIRLYPVTPDSYELIGRIDSPEPGRALQVRLSGTKTSLVATSDEYYLFRFDRVPSGELTMTIVDGADILGTIDLSL